MQKNRIFRLNFIILSLLLSYHLLNIAHGLIYSQPSAVSFIFSWQFFLGLCVLTPLLILMFTGLVKKYGIKQDEKKDRVFFWIVVMLLGLDFLLCFQRTTNRISFGLYNFVLFGAIAALYYRFNSFKNGISAPDNKRLFRVLLVTAGILTTFFGLFNMGLHNAFFTSSDMGIFTNATWRITHDGTQNTFIEEYKNHMGVHMQPILYLLSLLFRIVCSPYILVILQVVFVFFASAYVFLLAEKVTSNRAVSFLMSLAYLGSEFTLRTISYDYHPETMYMFMFFAFLYYAEARNFLLATVFIVLAVSMKEEAPVYMAAAAVFAFMRTKDKRYIVLSLLSAIYAYVAIKMIIPAYNSSNSEWLGLIQLNLREYDLNYLKTNFFLQFFIFLAAALFLPLLEWRALVFIFLPGILLHLARYDRGFQFLFDLHYSAFVTAPLFAAAVYGIENIRKKIKLSQEHFILTAFIVFLMQMQIHLSYTFKFSAAYVVTVTLIVLFLIVTAFAAAEKKARMNLTMLAAIALIVPYTGFYNFFKDKLDYIKPEHRASINKVIARLPEDKNAVVIGNINIIPHLCCRKYVWQQEWGNAARVLLPVINEKLKEFYMLVYLYDYSYRVAGTEPVARNREIHDLAVKMGFQYSVVHGDDVAALFKYSKEGN